jgi:hypothetical protein
VPSLFQPRANQTVTSTSSYGFVSVVLRLSMAMTDMCAIAGVRIGSLDAARNVFMSAPGELDLAYRFIFDRLRLSLLGLLDQYCSILHSSW